ncbi:MAG: dTDP-4-dehydrorhamnose 3,5-epimerase family protein [Nostocoides sp.]
MDIQPLDIEGAWVVTPRQFGDDRGTFLESFRADLLAEHTGAEFHTVQSNISVSSAGTVRGIHYADVPPSQAKYVTAAAGVLIDYIVDIRLGSPTFGQWQSVRLDTADRRAVYLSEGLGHALCALTDDATAVYLCSTSYNPSREHGIHPLDPQIALGLPADLTPTLSAKDASAPTLTQAEESGLLPTYRDCVAFRSSLRDERSGHG